MGDKKSYTSWQETLDTLLLLSMKSSHSSILIGVFKIISQEQSSILQTLLTSKLDAILQLLQHQTSHQPTLQQHTAQHHGSITERVTVSSTSLSTAFEGVPMTSRSAALNTLVSSPTSTSKNERLKMFGRVLENQQKIISLLDNIKKWEKSNVEHTQKKM